MNEINFWDVHGLWFCFFMFLFPRLTLFFGGIVTGGWLWWLGWVFTPRILCAILATTAYWDSNTVLVVFVWIWALGGTRMESNI